MLLTTEVKAKIDAMTYEELLEGWRFTKLGDEMFQGDSGRYWAQRLKQLRDRLGNGQHVAASKRIGWVSSRAISKPQGAQ